MSCLFFYFFAAVLIAASIGVIVARSPLHNVLALVVAIFSLSCLFAGLEAYFVGMILLLVYAGAVLIFFLFVTMCLNLNPLNFTLKNQTRLRWLGSAAGLLFFISVSFAIAASAHTAPLTVSSIRGTIENIGQILFTRYLLPFEASSFLLFIAIFGIVALAQGSLSSGNTADTAGSSL